MIYRLKTRLALANFKRQYGYERYDLYTLESSLLKSKKKPIKKTRHRYYPTHNHHGHKSTVPTSFQHQQQHHHHRSSLYPRYPLSEKRSTSPQQHHTSIIPTDEDAANVLVMLHNMS
ncbi:hypothetical protein INT47_008911 [Mucor saturninus]|uniref:Uncharacterized protein n=2 Tax=Mucor TaxID=4830 RepID=A0A8H7R1R0_9FUNG|nr:hypothetical protein INT47_008911 [Mucor saturninus]